MGKIIEKPDFDIKSNENLKPKLSDVIEAYNLTTNLNFKQWLETKFPQLNYRFHIIKLMDYLGESYFFTRSEDDNKFEIIKVDPDSNHFSAEKVCSILQSKKFTIMVKNIPSHLLR